MEDNRPVVFDIGSTLAKVGFADTTDPYLYTSLVGHPRHRGIMVGMGQKDCYVGIEALSKCGILVIEYPVQRGLIAEWYYMEKMWHHSFYNELRCAPEEHRAMILEHPLTPKDSREKTTQIMFETFDVPGLFFANPSVASLRAVGRTSGVSLYMGGQTTYSVVVKDGKGMMKTLHTIDIGGQDVTASMMKYMCNKHDGLFSTSAEREVIQDMRIKFGYVALDYDAELQRPENEVVAQYEDPGGWMWQLYHERFSHNEILFKPELHGIEKDGIHHMILNSIKKCDPSTHSSLFSNIVLSGGNALIRGLDARLIKELKALSPEHADHVRIESGPEGLSRQFLPFIGAARLAQTFTDWMTKAEYDEVGPSLVHTRCPIGVL
eukprot:TRINITY_DN1364_c1_g1_i1.p1 TRINITY_DN1364_c1_g1~~TRINITY_DN1364_c1_g1_i1.p1  ORF type:complete len:378 (+),score=38.38 TRINITY_DN1364_c1_g1_i1:335-1468(+)